MMPTCPGPDCVMCSGEACALCGAGLRTRLDEPPCEHDVIERHHDPSELRPIAALYVETNGVYFNVDGVDPWDRRRDARLYVGPHPVVAHPPCERWGRYWSGGPLLAKTPRQKKKGDDDGCFSAAIAAVREYGGVIEHPEASHAWLASGLLAPRRGFGWEPAGDWIGFTCCVEQGHFGHSARKATWLYAVAPRESLPEMPWGSSGKRLRLDEGVHSTEERRQKRARGEGPPKRLSKQERLATPIAFRDLLIGIARSAHGYVRHRDARSSRHERPRHNEKSIVALEEDDYPPPTIGTEREHRDARSARHQVGDDDVIAEVARG